MELNCHFAGSIQRDTRSFPQVSSVMSTQHRSNRVQALSPDSLQKEMFVVSPRSVQWPRKAIDFDAEDTRDNNQTDHRVRWRKMLYGGMQPGYEDNYTDSTFLEEMVMNANVRKRSPWTVMRDAVAVCQHICVVGLVATTWTHSLNGDLGAKTLLQLDALILILECAIPLLLGTHLSKSSIRRHALNFSLFVTALYILAPIFQTLTRSISSDSIWACTVCLLLTHLLFHDYTYTTMDPEILSDEDDQFPPDSPRTPLTPSRAANTTLDVLETKMRKQKGPPGVTFSANVSLHASIVASVLVASRLPDRLVVFALMLFSLEFFLLFPLVTHCVRRRSVNAHLGFCCVLIAVTMALIFPVNRLAFWVFVTVTFFITIVCPYWLIKIQEYKFEINGPWDEAKLCFDVED